jgi:hypothetical protein
VEAFEDPVGFAGTGPSDDAAMDAALAALLDGPAGTASGAGATGEELTNGSAGDAGGQQDDDGPGAGPRPEGNT